MNKQELIESISHLPSDCSRPRPMIDKLTALELIKLLDEPQKVTVPQFVADYIDFKKTYDFHVYGAMRVIEDHYDKRVQEWFYEGNIETFVHAWLDGYEVDKESKYTVKFKATKQYLSNDEIGIHFDPSFRSNFRKSDLEKLGLAEVFNSPLFEVEEVK
jgi:hypothetical protein